MTQEKLPKEFKRKWVKALRSGKYKQGNGCLYDEKSNAYCCLGIGGRVVGIKNFCGNAYLRENIEGFNKVPDIIRGAGRIPAELGSMNDFQIPFEVIAGVINEYL